MAGTNIMAEICTSPYPSSYPNLYPYPINAGILHQNGYKFKQYL